MKYSVVKKTIEIDMYYIMFHLGYQFHLNMFSDLEKKVLALYYTDRKSFVEIGKSLSLDKLEVGSVYHTCMSKLREQAAISQKEYFTLLNVQAENTLLKSRVAILEKVLGGDTDEEQPSEERNLLDKQFYELEDDFDLRTNNALRHAGINTLGDVILYSEKDLSNLRNMGSRSITWLKTYLEKKNLSLSLY